MASDSTITLLCLRAGLTALCLILPVHLHASELAAPDWVQQLRSRGADRVNASLLAQSAHMATLNQRTADCEPAAVGLAVGLGGHRDELALGRREVDVALGVLHRFFGEALGFGGLGFVEVLAADGGVGQHGHAVRLHFQDAAGDEDEFLAAVGLLDAHRAGLHARDQRRVARVDAELAGFTGKRDEARLAGEDGLLGAHHVDVDGVRGICHLFAPQAAIFLAFSKASSIVPTM